MKQAFLLALLLLAACTQVQPAPIVAANTSTAYHPSINPADFSSHITNRYLALTPGKKWVFEMKTDEGIERNEVAVTNETKVIDGVETRVVSDKVWLNGELSEDTKDWMAQDKDGTVWYFGEDTVELVDGKVTTHQGSWEAGVNGQPGIIMPAHPEIGKQYRQEYSPGVAEDMAEVIVLDESVTVPAGTYQHCVRTREWTPLEPGVSEEKVYCPDVGMMVLESEEGETSALVSVGTVTTLVAPSTAPAIQTKITEEDAKRIALERVPGTVTDVAIEKKFDRPAYVVEIRPDSGPETDVIIDVDTGEVLGIET
ncbi:MAG TPA: PepSY domain-containing protein [Candidatus Binatia bacterium]|nr:PepSY domain-containing protein [Candidatus Binatia bacterium]